MMPRFKNIQAKLFFSYSSLIIVIIIILVLSFYFTTSAILEQRASEAIQQLSLNISDKLDSEIRNMDSIALRVIASEPVKTLFYGRNVTPATELHNKWDITSMLFSITGTPFQFREMNLINLNGHFVTFGKENDIYDIPSVTVKNKDWIKSAIDMDGRKYITLPRKDDWDPSGGTVISLCRAFSEVFGPRYDSIVEIQQDYSLISNLIERSVIPPGEDTTGALKVYVYDAAGNPVYPYAPEGNKEPGLAAYYWQTLENKNAPYHTYNMKNIYTNEIDIIAFTNSDFTGWSVVIVQPESALMQPVRAFRNNLLLFGVIILLMTMLVTFFVSKGLTTPIRNIRNSIRNLSLKTLDTKPDTNITLNELEELNHSFVEMCDRLKKSLEEAVSAKSHEIQARMLALQAQMNPHFLYNSLSIISIKAEKNSQYDIMKMCRNLSEMLRYVAVESSKPVTIAVELDYLNKYLDLMKNRHVNQFECNIDIPPEMNALMVPRLLIQPLIENSFKYAFNVRPPWLIGVSGRLEGENWEITVSDNGQGFDEGVLQYIMNKTGDSEFEFSENEEKNMGIGLINIYYRLKLLYKGAAIFKVSNGINGGAAVTIGGSVRLEEDANE